MKTVLKTLAVIWAVLVAMGCSSVPNPYIPETVGVVTPGKLESGLQVRITPIEDHTPLGTPVLFRVHIRNVGENALWVPKDPTLVFLWTYPNGRRDNFVLEDPAPRHFREQEAVLLQPGHQVTLSQAIETYYFPRPGITEFSVVINVPRNTNPELDPFWHGELTSNSYGIRMMKPGQGVAQLAMNDTSS
ncbi:MAG: hypothetical protein KJ626_01805 [Verrucomicrobia bacterium]|nr:hypothetical protein [Verrucomicrobiota bacterium]